MTLRSNLGAESFDKTFYISPAEFANFFCVFCFDLTPDLLAYDQSHISLLRQGAVQVNYRLSKPLSDSTNLFILAEFDSVFKIYGSGNVEVSHLE